VCRGIESARAALSAIMTTQLPDAVKTHIDEAKVFATVATVDPDGRPHLTVVWLKRDGDDLLFSTTVDRVQGKNILRDPRVTVMINPADNPYVYAEIRGTATTTPDPTRVLPDELSYKYLGKDYASGNPRSIDDGDRRIVVRLTPDKVVSRF
jgi:PPOX class probable F420-dependent enzyme